MKDLRVEARFKNAALLRAIENKFSHLRAQSHNSGAGLLSKFAAHVGVSNQWLYQVASLSTSPFYEKRNAENIALRKLRHPARIAILKGKASLIP